MVRNEDAKNQLFRKIELQKPTMEKLEGGHAFCNPHEDRTIAAAKFQKISCEI